MRTIAGGWLLVAGCLALSAGATDVPRLASADFKLDGVFSEAKWQGALVCPFTNREATAYLARTENELYVGVMSKHGRPTGKVCDKTVHDTPVYDNDTAEVFIGVPGREGFWHVIGNVPGGIYDEYKDALDRTALDWDSGARAKGSYDDAADRYYIEMRLPLAVYSPVEGKITLAICSHTRWNQNGTVVLGEYFQPKTWTMFDVGEEAPLVLEKLAVSPIAGRQAAAITLSNRSSAPLDLTGTFAGEPVAWQLGAGETRTFEAFNRMARGETKEVALVLEAAGRRVLEAYRNLVAQPLLKAVPVSDIVWQGEPLKLRLTVFEKQTEPVDVEILPNEARCTYKGESVVVPYATDPAPFTK